MTYSGDGTLSVQNNAVIDNKAGGLFDIQGDSRITLSGIVAFTNTGTVQRSVSTGSASIEIPFDNNSLVEVKTGTLKLIKDGNASGNFNVSLGATLEFGGGTHTLDGSSSLSSAGSVTFTGAIVNFSGSYPLTGNTTISGGTVNFDSAVTIAFSLFTLNSGTVNFNAAVIIPSVIFNDGTLSGSGELTVTTALNWSDGTMSGSGKTIIPSSGVMTLSSTNEKFLSVRTVENSGMVNYTGSGELDMRDAATFTNQAIGLFDMQVDALIEHGFGAAPTFDNQGTFQKSGGPGTATVGVPFNNSSPVKVQNGTLSFTLGGTSSGNSMLTPDRHSTSGVGRTPWMAVRA